MKHSGINNPKLIDSQMCVLGFIVHTFFLPVFAFLFVLPHLILNILYIL